MDTGCNLEDQPGVMNNTDIWRQRERESGQSSLMKLFLKQVYKHCIKIFKITKESYDPLAESLFWPCDLVYSHGDTTHAVYLGQE